MMRWELVRREIVIPLAALIAAAAAILGIAAGLAHFIR